MLSVNLRAAISSVRAAAPKMIAQGSGRIISVGSIIGSAGKARFADYAAAKAGLTGYMKSAAIELGPFGITVNLVSPGIVPRGRPTQDELERLKQTNVLGAIGHEEDVAEAVGLPGESACPVHNGSGARRRWRSVTRSAWRRLNTRRLLG